MIDIDWETKKQQVFEMLKEHDMEIDYIKFAKPDSEERMKLLGTIISLGMFHIDFCQEITQKELTKMKKKIARLERKK